MLFSLLLRRFAKLALLLGAALSCVLVLLSSEARGGDAARSSKEARALRQAFPAEAAPVLDASRAFVSTVEGFGVHLPAEEAAHRSPSAPSPRLPRRGDGAIRFPLGDGHEAEVREVGATGEGALAERAVAYPRAGGTSFWAATEDGVEEWLLLSPSAVKRTTPIASWEVAGALPRQAGEAVEITDARGVPRLSVTAPNAYAVGGRTVATRLAARGARIELWVDAEDEALLVDPGWRFVSSMITSRAFHTATLLHDGRVLLAGGKDDKGMALSTADLYDPKTDSWTTTSAPMKTGRLRHTATLLLDGRVLFTGGKDGQNKLVADAEIYDPKSDTFAPAGKLNVARHYHTATLLGDGRVLVVGGDDDGQALHSVANTELYNTETNSFTLATPMQTPRDTHTATLLEDGRLLIAGGVDANLNKVLASATLYDPKTDSWAPSGAMGTARVLHSATLLEDGQVLMVGGQENTFGMSSSVTAELFDPKTQSFTPTGSMSSRRQYQAAVRLEDGRVLVSGGFDFAALAVLNSAEVYDPKTHHFILTGKMSEPRAAHSAVRLEDGRVLVTGGESNTTAETYDPKSDSFTPADEMSTPRADHTATLLIDGFVLVTGGASGASVEKSAEVYNPKSDSFTPSGDMSAARRLHTATLLHDGRALIAGGDSDLSSMHALPTVDLYDPNANIFTPAASMSVARRRHTSTLLLDGRVLIVGGENEEGLLGSAEVYDPATDSFTPTGRMSAARAGHSAALLVNGKVLIVGGTGKLGTLAASELYDPKTNAFRPVADTSPSRQRHTGTTLMSGRVLVAGGVNKLRTLVSTELYDPSTDSFIAAGRMTYTRESHTATRLEDGRVLVAGGHGAAGVEASTEVYDPKSQSFAVSGWMRSPRQHHTTTLLPDGRVLAVGGYADDTDEPLASAEIFDLQPLGNECTAGSQCQSSSCIDGVCCDASCDARDSCHACSRAKGAPSDGACKVTLSCAPFLCDRLSEAPACTTSCESPQDCPSGFCVDGVCCDTACEATDTCNVCSRSKGAKEDGTCTPILSCAPFRCDASKAAPMCATSCASPGDCAPGYACLSTADLTTGTCVPLPSLTSSRDYTSCALATAAEGPPGRPSPPLYLLFFTALAALGRACRRRPEERERERWRPR